MFRRSPRRRNRRSIRLKGYDYRHPGAYFVTICTAQMQPIFGTVINGEVQLNDFGMVAHHCWENIPTHFANVGLDESVVMPNHVHGIVVIRETNNVGATHASPLRAVPRPTSHGPPVGSLGAIIGSYKSAVTRHFNQIRNTPGSHVWQRNYYEQIIRDEYSFHRIKTYIRANTSR